MPRVRKGGLILPAAAVAAVLAAACSFDAGKLRARQLADSGARDATTRNMDATEADASRDHPQDQNLGVHDSFVEAVADRASPRSDLGPAAGAGGSLADARDTRTDLPLETGGSFDSGGAGGTGGMPASAGATATGGIGGALDAGGPGGSGGMTASGGATAAGSTGGALDAGGPGGSGGSGGMTASGGATAASGTGGAVSLPAGLVGWWKMDGAAGSSTAVDASGNGNGATLSGLNPTSAWTTGRTGGALKCDGSGAALVNDSASLDGIATGVTISAWVNRLSATTGFSAVLSRETGTTAGQYYWLGVSGDKAEFYGLSGVLSNATVPIGSWTHLAATHDGTTARIYVNGVQVTSQNSSNVFKADTSKLVICGNQNDASGAVGERWNGLVDDLQLYNRALTATEIAGLVK
jgi:hypothetical protein